MLNEFGIRINGVMVDLVPGQQFDMSVDAPWFNMDVLGNSEYTLEVHATGSEVNQNLFGFAHNPNIVATSLQIAGAELLCNGAVVSSGILYVDKATADFNNRKAPSYVLQFVGGNSTFVQGVKNLKLWDLPLGGTLIANELPSTSAAIAAMNVGICGDVIKLQEAYWFAHANNLIDGTASAPYCFPPIYMPNAKKPYLQGIANYFDANYQQYPLAGRNSIQQDLWGTGNEGTVTAQTTYGGTLGGSWDWTKSGINGLIPCFKLWYILEKIFADNGWVLSGDLLSTATFQRLFLMNNYDITSFIYTCHTLPGGYTNVLVDVFAGVETAIGGGSLSVVPINPQNHVPDMLVTDFLIQIQNLFCGKFIFNQDKTVVFYTKKEVLRGDHGVIKNINDKLSNSYEINLYKATDNIKLPKYASANDNDSDWNKAAQEYFVPDYTVNLQTDLASIVSPQLNQTAIVLALQQVWVYSPDISSVGWVYKFDNVEPCFSAELNNFLANNIVGYEATNLIGVDYYEVNVLPLRNAIIGNGTTSIEWMSGVFMPQYFGDTFARFIWWGQSDAIGNGWAIAVKSDGSTALNFALSETLFSNFRMDQGRIAFWHGMVTGAESGGLAYPLCTNHQYQNSSTKLTGVDFHLGWQGPQGLYEFLLETWMKAIRNSGQIACDWQMDILDYLNLDYCDKYMNGNTLVWMQNLKIKLPMNVAAKGTFIQIR